MAGVAAAGAAWMVLAALELLCPGEPVLPELAALPLQASVSLSAVGCRVFSSIIVPAASILMTHTIAVVASELSAYPLSAARCAAMASLTMVLSADALMTRLRQSMVVLAPNTHSSLVGILGG